MITDLLQTAATMADVRDVDDNGCVMVRQFDDERLNAILVIARGDAAVVVASVVQALGRAGQEQMDEALASIERAETKPRRWWQFWRRG